MKKLVAIFVHPLIKVHAPPQRRLYLGDGWQLIEVSDTGVSVFIRGNRCIEAAGSISRCWGCATPRHHAAWQWEHVTN